MADRWQDPRWERDWRPKSDQRWRDWKDGRDGRWERQTQPWGRRTPRSPASHANVDPPVTLKVVNKDQLVGPTYGCSTWSLYEACTADQEGQEPVLLLWLHGADMGEIPGSDLLKIHQRLRRRAFFLVPMNPRFPKGAEDSHKFFWGIRYSKGQNKGSLGFVFGELHEPYLADLAGLVQRVVDQVSPFRTYAFGYSMGGFGVYQIAGFAPELFDAAVAIAGYGQGTLDPADSGYGAPQPASSNIFENFLRQHAPRLARIPIVLTVHARLDTESSYNDAVAIVDRVNAEGGHAELVSVPDGMAESDPHSKRARKTGHRYFNYTLLHDTSEEVLYERLEARLAAAPRRKQVQLVAPIGVEGEGGPMGGAEVA